MVSARNLNQTVRGYAVFLGKMVKLLLVFFKVVL